MSWLPTWPTVLFPAIAAGALLALGASDTSSEEQGSLGTLWQVVPSLSKDRSELGRGDSGLILASLPTENLSFQMEAHLRWEISSHQRRSHSSTIDFELGALQGGLGESGHFCSHGASSLFPLPPD